MPKLILQPLLENCFQHGFRERSDEVCRLRLTIGFENTALCIVVEDDGEGMSQERQRALEQALQSDSESFACFIRRSKHIGLRNVNARLCLHCRVAKAVWIDRSPLGGTRVTLRLPRGGRMAARAPRLTREGGSQAAQSFDCG
ncbi:ATP-binding protein [Agathobaculum sp. NTUH-O15-33]|uniref:sensor histidine kinase n=1 Tax=Agathobaculum sp. NTUH-O15-33 TaxID=3079302 RepID=UPI0029583F55|nr:ATP-binding protein [Agathobaculum sp. NTUH-O15-33]WNX84521.1 ATP-binding protein [Agathobaculum sp. NTUH-O15-33]